VAKYFQFLGSRVTVRYRVGEILLSATGTFSADSGRSIFLEQHIEQRGTRKYFRWEIPYPYIYRIELEAEQRTQVEVLAEPRIEPRAKAAAAAAGESSSGSGTSLSPFLDPSTPFD
jgi:hypothetical protein